jgi:hypothetical protein
MRKRRANPIQAQHDGKIRRARRQSLPLFAG